MVMSQDQQLHETVPDYLKTHYLWVSQKSYLKVHYHYSNLPCRALVSLISRFTEFESAEEMENSRLEVMRGIQCQVLATTPRQAPPRLPASEVAEEPGRLHKHLGFYAEAKSVKIDVCHT